MASGRAMANKAASSQETEGQRVQNREEMHVAREAVKKFRGLCKDYSVPYHPSIQGVQSKSAFRRRRGDRMMLSHMADTGDSSSSCSSDDSDESNSKGDGGPKRWEEIKGILDNLETTKRWRAVKDIAESLGQASENAQTELETLEELEQSQNNEEEGTVVDETLLKFQVENMPAIQALKRCAQFAPALTKRASERMSILKSMPGMSKQADSKKDAEAHSQSEADMDDDMEDTGVRSEVNLKLQRLGQLPKEADIELRIVLEAQREEIRAMAQRIDEGEKKVQVQRLALDYIDGNLDPNSVEQDQVNAAISAAQEIRNRLLKEKREESERKLRQERLDANIPTEEEVRVCIEGAHELLKRAEHVDEMAVKLIKEDTQEALVRGIGKPGSASSKGTATDRTESHEGADFDKSLSAPGSSPTKRRQALRTNGLVQAAPMLEVSHEDAPQVHQQLKKQAAELEEQITECNGRIATSEVLFRNAEHTLKTLEETKTLFLEQVAREKPAMIEAFGIVSQDKEDNDSSSESEHSSEEELEGEELLERIKALEAEEQFLRLELSLAENGLDAGDDSDDDEAPEDPAGGGDEGDGGTEDRVSSEIRRLVHRVEHEVNHSRRNVAKNEEGSSKGSESEGEESDGQDAAPVPGPNDTSHAEMQELLQLQDENAKLLERIKEIQNEIHDLRMGAGALELKQADEEKYDEMQRKMRELQALRKRWWSERQDPQTTVRRALAAQDLEIDPKAVDMPPNTAGASLFQRIQASMTAP